MDCLTFYWALLIQEGWGDFLEQHTLQPPASEGTPRPPNLTIELETLVRALRDAEILAHGIIPATCVKNSFEVYY